MSEAPLDRLSVLAVVPARGGSVGIPRKNLRQLAGLSLIARAAQVIGELAWITRAVISTDDAEMSQEGVRFGLDAPFARPPELAHGSASGPDVLFHAWVECERHYDTRFDYALYLEPTSPLRRPGDIVSVVGALLAGDHDSAVTVSRAPGHFTPEKCLKIDESGLLEFYLAEGINIHARQQIQPYYFRNGIAYATRREPFFKSRKIVGANTLAVVVDRPVVNIDEPFELELAEWLLAREHGHAR